MRRVPILATLVVAVAVATMVALGLWQVGRAQEKERLLARYAAAQSLPPERFFPETRADVERFLFRRIAFDCRTPAPGQPIAGRNRQGVSGYSHIVDCNAGEGGRVVRLDIGWSQRPRQGLNFAGGVVGGIITTDRTLGFRVVSDRGIAGLEPSAAPDLASIPNNHRSYAFQWFAFAVAAVVIYALALKARRRAA